MDKKSVRVHLQLPAGGYEEPVGASAPLCSSNGSPPRGHRPVLRGNRAALAWSQAAKRGRRPPVTGWAVQAPQIVGPATVAEEAEAQ